MHIILYKLRGGSGGSPPENFFEKWCFMVQFGIQEHNYMLNEESVYKRKWPGQNGNYIINNSIQVSI